MEIEMDCVKNCGRKAAKDSIYCKTCMGGLGTVLKFSGDMSLIQLGYALGNAELTRNIRLISLSTTRLLIGRILNTAAFDNDVLLINEPPKPIKLIEVKAGESVESIVQKEIMKGNKVISDTKVFAQGSSVEVVVARSGKIGSF